MLQRTRLLLLIPHLGGGGAERVTALLARGLSPTKYELHLALITQSEISSEDVPTWVEVHTLGLSRVRFAAIPLIRLVRTLQPDLILSGMAHLNFLTVVLRPLFPRRTRVILRQNAMVSGAFGGGRVPRYTRYLYRFLYPAANTVVCQTQAMAADLAMQSGRFKMKLQVLANPVDADAIRNRPVETEDPWQSSGPRLLACGRLSPEKGFDLLIESFASLRLEFPGAQLMIVGSGPDHARLIALRNRLRLNTSVRFAGHVTHPERFFHGATLFVLPSRQDSLPNALLEAAAGGLPLVALPSSEGVVHLLKGKPGVWLGTEISSRVLTRCLLSALDSLQAGERFPHEWLECFHMDSAIRGYERLIDEILGK